MTALVALALVVAVGAAARSTWSPCGLSMLSTITPLAEAARGHRYRATATWFAIGAVLGGLSTGMGAAALAAVVAQLDLSVTTTLAVAAALAVLAVGVDLGVLGPPLPHHPRQVEDAWLRRYRPWVYGAGFGWQIGTGLLTYIMTAAVYLVIALAALSARPAVALGICAWFGLCRGSAIIAGSRITDTERLRAAHHRFDEWAEPVRRAVIGLELVVAVTAGVLGGPVAVIALLVAGAIVGLLVAARARRTPVASVPLRSPG